MSEFIGVMGLAMIAVAAAVLWIMRLNSNVAATPASDVMEREELPDSSTRSSSYRVNLAPPPIAPEAKPTSIPAQGSNTRQSTSTVAPKENPKLAQQVEVVPEQPDSEVAAEQLKIAEQLCLIGDYEGVIEFAELVSEDADASPRQRSQAENLIRRAKTF